MGEKQKHCGRKTKTLWERFKNPMGEKKNTMGA